MSPNYLSEFYSNGCKPQCSSLDGCPTNICPDFVLKRYDTKPAFKISMEDCDGVMDLSDETLIAEVNIWGKAKLKKAINDSIDYISFADNIGFNQVMVGDVILMDRVRLPEQMLVLGFDESNKLIQVQRGYRGTAPTSWEKGTPLKFFRTQNGTAEIETVLGDILQEDGTTLENQIQETYLVYNWDVKDSCTPGCFWLEFKLLKMSNIEVQSLETISNITFTPSTMDVVDFGCYIGDNVEWVRRFPSNQEGFLIKINDTPTQEI